MTPLDKRNRWPFLDEAKTINVTSDRAKLKDAQYGDFLPHGTVRVFDAPTLAPESFRRLSISDSMPLEAYAPTRGEE